MKVAELIRGINVNHDHAQAFETMPLLHFNTTVNLNNHYRDSRFHSHFTSITVIDAPLAAFFTGLTVLRSAC
jgi:hypothetical protein